MSITSVHIQNFRSIVSFKSCTKDLNIFVGQNDKGKSNVLRALDLFFNHDKKTGFELVWDRDYCKFAPERKRKAREISIEIEVVPPESFSNRNPVFWRRVWRRDGFHSKGEHVLYKNGDGPSPRSKIGFFLNAMRYDYVPAIKGPEFFKQMLSSLHDMLEATVAEDVRSASGSFTKTINKNTEPILKDIEKRLGLPTTIELPTDLRELFAQLEFTSVSGHHPFSLSQRGDGIKVRHIPIVLRWLAEQANHLSAKGKPKIVTVWGYEEPENNLELRKCLDLAREFVEFCPTIQTFVTTHSPAFYSICREEESEQVQLFGVEKSGDPPVTEIKAVEASEVGAFDLSMGLLEFLTPHMHDAQERIKRLEAAQATLTNTTTPTLFVEGPSDKALIECVLAQAGQNLGNALCVKCSEANGGGHSWVKDMLLAWHYRRSEARAVGLFDSDAAAKASRKEVDQIVTSRNNARTVEVCPNDVLIECFTSNYVVPFSPDELLSEAVWDHAEKQEWLEPRPKLLELYPFSDPDESFTTHLKNTVPDAHRQRLIRYRVKSEAKSKLCGYVGQMEATEKTEAVAGLVKTIHECLKKLYITW